MSASWLDRRPPSALPGRLMPPAIALAAGLPLIVQYAASLVTHIHGMLAATGSALGAGSRALAGNRIIDTAALPCIAPETVAAIQRAGARLLEAKVDAGAVVAAIVLVAGVLIACALTASWAGRRTARCHTSPRLSVSESGAASRRATTPITWPGRSFRAPRAGEGAHPWA